MGSTSSTSGSTFKVGGLASGLDTNAIVDQLMQLERRPLTKLQSSQTKIQERKTGLGEISTKLSALRTATSTLMLSTATQTRGTSSTNTAVATATASANTSVQSFSVSVSQLATRTTLASGSPLGSVIDGTTVISALPNTNLTTGSGTITVGIRNTTTGVVTSKELTVNATDTLSSVQQAVEDAINLNLLPSGGATSTFTNGQLSYVAPAGYELIFGSANDTANVFTATNLSTASADTTATGTTTLAQAGWVSTDPTGGTPTYGFTIADAAGNKAFVGGFNSTTTLNDVVTALNTALTSAGSGNPNTGGLGLTGATASLVDGKITITNYNGTLNISSTNSWYTPLGAPVDNAIYNNSLIAALKLPTSTSAAPIISSGVISSSSRTYTASAATTSLSPTATLNTSLGISGASEFRVNGTVIEYDPATDTVNSIITKINSSGAGVLASYDTLTGKVSLQNRNTGSLAITVDDSNGNGSFDLIAGLNLGSTSPGSTTLGQNARYSINGAATQSSNSNTVTNAVSGVTLSLAGTLNTTTTIAITQDTTTAVTNVKAWVTAFNDALNFVQENTKIDPVTKTRARFSGDAMIEGIRSKLRTALNSAASGLTTTYKSLPSIGLSTGAVGSAVGSTNTLVLDEAKFTAALQADPTAVSSLLSVSSGPLDTLKTFLLGATAYTGTLNSSQTAADTQLRDLAKRIADMNLRLADKQTSLERKYSQLEATMSKLQAQSSSLSSQLAGLSKNS